MEIRNPVYTEDGLIDCELNHPQFGWIPFTANPNDSEQTGRDAYQLALGMGIAAYVPPTAEDVLAAQRAGMRLTFAQLLIGLVAEGWITQAEGTAWLAGTPPAVVSALIAQLPAEQQFAALARAVRPSEVLRLDALVVAMGQAAGKTPEELDEFFQTYRNV